MQKPLFYDGWKDAFRRAIEDSGRSWKEVAHHLRPDMKIDSAYAWLKACLKDDGDQKLDFGQGIALMNFCGQFDPLYHICDETSHDRPAQRAPEDARAELQREYIAAMHDMERLVERMERLNGITNFSKAAGS